MTKLDLALVRIDGGTQLRAKNNEEAIQEYSALMRDGVVFPPVDVFFDGVAYWLAHGFHRYHSARACGHVEIEANVQTGTLTDAILFACGANAEHGVKRTAEDKRNAVRAALKVFEGRDVRRSDDYVAKHCAVNIEMVQRLRANTQLTGSGKLCIPTQVQGKDGKTYDTTKIGKGKPKPVVKPKLRVVAEPERAVPYSSTAIGEVQRVWELCARHAGARDALVKAMEALIAEHRREVSS